MATRIDFDFTEPSAMTKGAKATYDWNEWLDGDTWQLVWGEDFQPHPLMMERIIRTRATGRGENVEIRHKRHVPKATAALIRALKAQAKTASEKDADLMTKAAEALAEAGGPFGAVVIHRIDPRFTPPPPNAKKAPAKKTVPVKAATPTKNGKAPSKRPVRRLTVAK